LRKFRRKTLKNGIAFGELGESDEDFHEIIIFFLTPGSMRV